MLTDLATYKAAANITTTAYDTQITALVTAADSIVKNFTKRALETSVFQEYRDGTNTPDLALYQRPIRFVMATGNLTSGSPTITGLSTTTGLIVGMPVTVKLATSTPAIPLGTTILSINTGASTVTLSQNVTATGTAVSLVFGLACYLDSGGYYGQGNGGFAAITQLFLGTDYVCKVDQPDGSSKCGIIRRLGGGPTAGPLAWPYGPETARGALTARRAPIWSNWYGNISVSYAAGLGTGPVNGSGSTLPGDLTYAANEVVSWMKRTIKLGQNLNSETLDKYAYQLHYPAPGDDPEVGSIRQILSRYREVAW